MNPRLSTFGRSFLVLAGIGLSGCSTLSLFNDPMGPRTAGDNTREAPVQIFSVDWWRPLVTSPMWEYSPRETATPAVDPDSGRVVVGTRDGKLRSFSVDGRQEWTFETKGAFVAGGVIENDTLYMPGGDGVLYAFKASTGAIHWKFPAGEELATIPVVADGKVLVASQNDTLFAVDQKTGKWLWQYKRDPPPGFTIRGMSSPTVGGKFAYIGFSDGVLVALDIQDGVAKWERSLSGGVGAFLDIDTKPVLDAGGHVFAASYKDGVFALNAETGEVVWQSAITGITALVTRGDVLYATGDARITALLLSTGRTIWSYELKGRAGRIPMLAKGMLIVPADGALVFVDPQSGTPRLSWDPGQGVSAAPRLLDSRLYVLSNSGTLFAMHLAGSGG
ncbi:MAG: outer membrane protein assembly factor BamB family protein [Myxococcaceae bacterium]